MRIKTRLFARAPSRHAGGSSTRRWLREPLLHFLLFGLLLFASYRLVQGPAAPATNRIEVTQADVERLKLSWQGQWGRAPNEKELADLVAGKVHDDILYREALALGLDRDDTIVKRRLTQKMEFLAEDLGALKEPTAQQLQAWYASHSAEYADAPRVSFRHLYFSTDQRAAQAADAARAALGRLKNAGADAREVRSLGDPFMYQSQYAERTPHEIGQIFGKAFASAVFKLQPGLWQGPLASGYGWHLVWVDELLPPRPLPFAQVETQVKEDWLRNQRVLAQQKYYQRIKERYQVVIATSNAAGARQ